MPDGRIEAEPRLRLRRLTSIREVDAAAWNALGRGDPFLRHEFLTALETSGCIGPGTAWRPCHLLLTDANETPLGALPLYWKYDSRGEFVFDWSWADAYERAGMRYYPKLVSASPFTPATGPRLLIDDPRRADTIAGELIGGALRLAEEANASTLHVLFPPASERAYFLDRGFLERKGCQFHWHNEGYADFDDFLSRFSSAKRKKARRERRRIAEAEIRFEHLRADEPSPSNWDAIYEFYSRTFLRRGRRPYLNRAFFKKIIETMPESLVVILARLEQAPIAAAICFRSDDTLYGRYWGSVADFHSLHFETCYYQGIDYCIRHGLERFEPGTQGEHKISRGFSPRTTWSHHWVRDPAFREAIAAFVHQEAAHVDGYIDYVGEHVPYRRDRARRSSP